MDTYNNRRDPRPDETESFFPRISPALVPGLILVGLGVLFLLDNLNILHASTWVAYWPVILIAYGTVKLVDAITAAGRVFGGLCLVSGGLFLADNLGYLRFRMEDLWPLMLIAVGLILLWQRTHPGSNNWFSGVYGPGGWARRGRFDRDVPPLRHAVHEFALFSGSRRVVTDQDFKGGRIHCLFGGVTLDLTGANMVANAAVLDVSAVYGGAVVRVPTAWNVEIRGAGIFGGFSDHTIHPPVTPDMKRLIVRGGAVFGGVTFRN